MQEMDTKPATRPDRALRRDRPERPMVSIVSPAYNEAENLPIMYERLVDTMSKLDVDWEWIVVDDHSRDATFQVVAEISQRDERVRALRFARNFGAHTAITCGIDEARGDCCVGLAADLQDPPETIPELLEKWRAGGDVVWAVRAGREGEKATTIGLSWLYYWIMRRVVGIEDIPATGADFLLMDRIVIEAFRRYRESNTSILALITWMGFRQDAIVYDKQARLHGRSGWGLKQKLKLAVDSITSFSYLPIRLMSYLGFFIAVVGFFYALFIIVNAISGVPIQGWSSLMVITLVLGGVQMLMLGVLGEYLWRALDESRRRPRYLIETTTDGNVGLRG